MANIRPGKWFSDFWSGHHGHLHHSTLDTDCLVAALAVEAVQRTELGAPVAAALTTLGIEPTSLSAAADAVRPAGGSGDRHPKLTARIEQVAQRARDDAVRMAGSSDKIVEVSPINLFHAVLAEDKGPGADALRVAGVHPIDARRLLGLPEPRAVHILPALWPPPSYPREFVYPDEISRARREQRRLPTPAIRQPPDPSSDAEPTAFVWTSDGQQLEMWAPPGGPIRLRVSPGNALQVSAEAAELIGRMLNGFYTQIQAERWEPIYEAERRGLPKPPPPEAQ